MKQGAFQRWTQKYIVLEDRKLVISKDQGDKNKEVILLNEAVITEASLRNTSHSFLVITPLTTVTFAASSRRELQQWMMALKYCIMIIKHKDPNVALEEVSRQHTWFISNHSTRTFCNVCGEALHGVAWNGLSCEDCRYKTHRRCAFGVVQGCKWTTRDSIERDGCSILENNQLPHQWLEGNLPTGSKCVVCQKVCGTVMRLVDYRCLWCKQTVHTECRESLKGDPCSLGIHRHFIVPPTLVKKSDTLRRGLWELCDVKLCQNPCLALINSRSGDNQGVRFLRRFKQILNPFQVYDISTCGPEFPLLLFKQFSKCSVIACGGDGSFGWVLATLDKLGMHDQCMLGTLPLGTGNDLSRVLGWGAACDDDQKLPGVLYDMEHSGVRLLDRWSIQHSSVIDENLHHEEEGGSDSQPQSRSSSPEVFGEPFPSPSVEHPVQSLPHQLIPRATWPLVVRNERDSSSHSLDRLSNEGERDDVALVTSKCEMHFEDNSSEEDHYSSTGEIDEERQELIGSSNELDVDHEVPKVERENSVNMAELHDSLAAHFSNVMLSNDDKEVISSSQILYSELKNFTKCIVEDQVRRIPQDSLENDPLVQNCKCLDSKLENLVGILRGELETASVPEDKSFVPREAVMERADSLRKAAKSLIDQVVSTVDMQEQTTAEVRAIAQENLVRQSERQRPNYLATVSTGIGSKKTDISPMSQSSPETPGVFRPGPDFREIGAMNNYFGIGLDAKITYEFHTRREENPKHYTSRAKNIVLMGLLGGKEFLQGTQRGFENRIRLECDGKMMKLPRGVQGIVVLNIPSYMAGTNFWGTERSTGNFKAPSIDDKLMEVVAITGTNMATAKVFKFQFSNRRIAQCRSLRILVDGHEKVPVQVDGEAWMQDPGVICITHKNKARMIVRDKAFSHSLHSWNQSRPIRRATTGDRSFKQSHLVQTLDESLLQSYKNLVFTTRTLIACLKVEAQQNTDVKTTLLPISIEATRALNIVFPDDVVATTATTGDLKEMERKVKNLIQETRWFINMKKISQDYEIVMKDAIQRVEGVMRRILYPKQHGDDPKVETHATRHMSDSRVMQPSISDPRVMAVSKSFDGTGCTLAAYYNRQRSKQLDFLPSSENIKRYSVDEVKLWDIARVCEWLEEISFSQYLDQFKAHEIRGQELVGLQKSDLMDMGITKVGHLTYLRKHVQSFRDPNKEEASSNESRDED
jgi:diacylglycerol kinase (ATP)